MSEGRLFSFPRPPEIFVGREKELNRLKEGFKSQNFIIIDGIAGIGKTSLALTLAGIINEDPLYSLFHNNVFWIECKEGWQIDNLLYEINRSLKYKGENSFDKSLEDERMVIKDKIHYLLTLLNKNYYVIFIDDYHKLSGSESVFFLEKLKQYLKKSKVVTISREKPKVSPVIWLETFEQRLKGLAYNDINILIKELLELHDYSYILDKKILNDLTRTTKGHPLLIKTLLCILISGGHTIVDLLEDAPSFKEATDDYLISQIISNLKEDERELLFSASLFRLPVKKEAFHYVYPVEKLDRLINSLQGKFLLNLYCANTYLIHDLIRDFCYASLLPDKKKELHRRCALYYEYIETIEDKRLPLSKEAFYHYIESGKTDRASEILENIMNEMVRYLQLKELEQYIDKIPLKNRNYRINLMKAELFFIKGDYKSTMNLLEDISDTEFTKTELINLKAKCNLRLGKYEKAMEYVDRNLKICQDVKTLLCLIKALEIKGIINFELRNYEEALTCFRKAIDVNDKEMKSSEFEISLSLFMGMTLERMGKTGEALEIHLNCLNLAEKTHNLREIPGLKINIGWDYYQMGEMEKAYEYLEQGLEIAHTDRLRVYSLYFMGLLFEEKNEEESAFSNFLKALKIAEELGDIDKQTVIKIMIVRLYIKTGKYKEGRKTAREIEKLISKQHSYIKGEYLIIMSEINLLEDNLSEVRSSLKKLLELCDEEKDIFQICRARYLMSIISSREEDKTLWKLKSQELLHKLYGNEKRKILKFYTFFEEFLSHKDKNKQDKYRVKRREREYEADIIEVEKLKGTSFDLWIDVTSGTVWEKNRGFINFTHKRKLSSLLFYLVKNAGQSFSQEELYTNLWSKKFNRMTDSITVKTSISRLRKLLEYDLENPKYFKTYTVPYMNESRYYFPEDINFCLIESLESKKD